MIPVQILALQYIPNAAPTLCDSLGVTRSRPSLGLITTDSDDATYIALDEATKAADVTVSYARSFYAGAANATDCKAAIRDGLKLRGIETGPDLFVRYCRVGAGDAIGDLTGCELVCMLVGERPGLVTDKSMSAYITYKPHTGVSESARTVVSNIHAQGTPAVEAGAYIAELIEKILTKKISGVGLHTEAGA